MICLPCIAVVAACCETFPARQRVNVVVPLTFAGFDTTSRQIPLVRRRAAGEGSRQSVFVCSHASSGKKESTALPFPASCGRLQSDFGRTNDGVSPGNRTGRIKSQYRGVGGGGWFFVVR